jgi:hypothetical protein
MICGIVDVWLCNAVDLSNISFGAFSPFLAFQQG